MLVPYNRKNHSVYNPFQDFDDLEKAFFSDRSLGELKTDIKDLGESYALEADLPGFKKDEVNVELHDGYLTVTAAKGLDKDEKGEDGHYLRRERYAGSCSRSFYVGEDVEPEEVSAKFEDGILTISVPKAAKKQLPKQTSINIL